mgnify:CR=1 FL=1
MDGMRRLMRRRVMSLHSSFVVVPIQAQVGCGKRAGKPEISAGPSRLRAWPSGQALAFQASHTSSTLVARSTVICSREPTRGVAWLSSFPQGIR